MELPKMRVQKQLVFGEAKTGKSHYCLTVFDWLKSNGYKPNDCYFAIIDADDGILPLIARGVVEDEWKKCIDYYYASDFKVIEEATKTILSKAQKFTETNWIIVDNMARVWELTQRQFSLDVYGKDYIELLKQRKIEALMKQKKGQPTFDRIHDFAIINSMHNDWLNTIVASNINFILTAPLERQYDNEGRDITAEVQPLPRGQKDNVFKVDTMLHKYRKDGKFYTAIVGTRLLPPPYPTIEGSSFSDVIAVLKGNKEEVKNVEEDF